MLVVCLQDLTTYNKRAVAIAKKYFNISDIDDFYKKTDPKPLIFCHFAKGLSERVYNEVTDYSSMYNILIEVGSWLHSCRGRWNRSPAAAPCHVHRCPPQGSARQLLSAFAPKVAAWYNQHSLSKGKRHQLFASWRLHGCHCGFFWHSSSRPD